jgi:hypothetical protein
MQLHHRDARLEIIHSLVIDVGEPRREFGWIVVEGHYDNLQGAFNYVFDVMNDDFTPARSNALHGLCHGIFEQAISRTIVSIIVKAAADGAPNGQYYFGWSFLADEKMRAQAANKPLSRPNLATTRSDAEARKNAIRLAEAAANGRLQQRDNTALPGTWASAL